MNDQKKDRRVRRTRRLLKDSLISLLQEKEFKNISVTDITTRADLNRGTFYLHYSDIYHLLLDMEEDLLHDFQQMIDDYRPTESDQNSLLGILIPIIDYIAENRAICHLMFENDASSDFQDRFHHLIQQNGRAIMQTRFPDADDDSYQMFFEFITYGTIGLLRSWINNGQDIPREQLAQIADRAILGAAGCMLG